MTTEELTQLVEMITSKNQNDHDLAVGIYEASKEDMTSEEVIEFWTIILGKWRHGDRK